MYIPSRKFRRSEIFLLTDQAEGRFLELRDRTECQYVVSSKMLAQNTRTTTRYSLKVGQHRVVSSTGRRNTLTLWVKDGAIL